MSLVETIYESNYRDVVTMLRNLADSIEEEEYGEVHNAAVVMRTGEGFEVFGFGDITANEVPFLLQLGLYQLTRLAWNYRSGEDSQ